MSRKQAPADPEPTARTCVRCGHELSYGGLERLRVGGRGGLAGALLPGARLVEDILELEMYFCDRCGSVDWVLPAS